MKHLLALAMLLAITVALHGAAIPHIEEMEG